MYILKISGQPEMKYQLSPINMLTQNNSLMYIQVLQKELIDGMH